MLAAVLGTISGNPGEDTKSSTLGEETVKLFNPGVVTVVRHTFPAVYTSFNIFLFSIHVLRSQESKSGK